MNIIISSKVCWLSSLKQKQNQHWKKKPPTPTFTSTGNCIIKIVKKKRKEKAFWGVQGPILNPETERYWLDRSLDSIHFSTVILLFRPQSLVTIPHYSTISIYTKSGHSHRNDKCIGTLSYRWFSSLKLPELITEQRNCIFHSSVACSVAYLMLFRSFYPWPGLVSSGLKLKAVLSAIYKGATI